jgi:hypothetical protein
MITILVLDRPDRLYVINKIVRSLGIRYNLDWLFAKKISWDPMMIWIRL